MAELGKKGKQKKSLSFWMFKGKGGTQIGASFFGAENLDEEAERGRGGRRKGLITNHTSEEMMLKKIRTLSFA